MAIQKTDKIWHNGKLIPWDDAKLHVMSHVVNYGSSVFEGVRCYSLPSGPAIFRAREHAQRLIDSAKVYRIDVDYSFEDIVHAMCDVVANNGVIFKDRATEAAIIDETADALDHRASARS